MQKSESIKELTKALIEVQKEITGAPKSSSNPYFDSKYADLATCWEVLKEPLYKNGLVIIQAPKQSERGAVCVETTLSHVSGEWVSCELTLYPSKQDPQAYGSALTYIRRYSLCALVGLYQVDDDANTASPDPRAPHTKPGYQPQPKGGF